MEEENKPTIRVFKEFLDMLFNWNGADCVEEIQERVMTLLRDRSKNMYVHVNIEDLKSIMVWAGNDGTRGREGIREYFELKLKEHERNK